MADNAGVKGEAVVILGICLLLGFVLRVQSLGSRSLWTDEFFTLFLASGHGAQVSRMTEGIKKEGPLIYEAGRLKLFLKNDARKGIGDVVDGVCTTDTHPPLYYGIMYYWMKVWGDGVFSVRIFSVLVGLLAVLLAYGVGLYLFDRHTAFFSALVLSCINFAVRLSQEARSYSLVIALALLSWLLLLRFERERKAKDLYGFLIISCLGLYAHYFYLFISLGQFVYFTVRYRNTSFVLTRYYLAFLGSWALYAPWFICVLQKGYNFHLVEWVFGYPGTAQKFSEVFRGPGRYFFLSDKYPMLLFILGIFFFLALGALWRERRAVPAHSAAILFCLCMIIVPLACMLCIDLLEQGALLAQIRFWTFPFVGCIPVFGYYMSRLYGKARVASFAVILLLISATLATGSKQFGPASLFASRYIHARSQGNTCGVIVYGLRSIVFAQSFYLDDGVYVASVYDLRQFWKAVERLSKLGVGKIFVIRHYHPTSSLLMNKPFMEVKEGTALDRYAYSASVNKDYIAITEYTR